MSHAASAGVRIPLPLLSCGHRANDIQTGQIFGALVQLGERLPCKQEVAGSTPAGSTISSPHGGGEPVIRCSDRRRLVCPASSGVVNGEACSKGASLFRIQAVVGSIPSLSTIRACNSVWLECHLDTVEVVGSIPTRPTTSPSSWATIHALFEQGRATSWPLCRVPWRGP